MDSITLDNTTAMRIIHYLITPFSQWDAFRLGIIDANGNERRPPKPSEMQYYNLLHRLCYKIRKIMQVSPGANKVMAASVAGEFFLNQKVPAAVLTAWSPSNKMITPALISAYSSVKEAYLTSSETPYIIEECSTEMQASFYEEVGNVVANAQVTEPVGGAPSTVLLRKEPRITFKQWMKNKSDRKPSGSI